MTATFNLRLTEDDHAALRLQAEREGRSMHEVALSAVRERVGTAERLEYLRSLAAGVHREDEKLLYELGHR